MFGAILGISNIFSLNNIVSNVMERCTIDWKEDFKEISCMDMSPSGSFICGGPAGKLMLKQNSVAYAIQLDNTNPVGGVRYLKDKSGRFALFFWRSKQIWLGSFDTGLESISFESDYTHGSISCLTTSQFYPDVIAWGCETGELYVKNISTEDDEWVLKHSTDKAAIEGMDFTASGHLLITGAADGSLNMWNVSKDKNGYLIGCIQTTGSPICSLDTLWNATRPDQIVVVTGHENGSVLVWDAVKKKRLAILGPLGGDQVFCVQVLEKYVDPSGKSFCPLVIMGNDAGLVRLYAERQMDTNEDDVSIDVEQWILLEEMHYRSPIVSIRFDVVRDTLWVASCENGLDHLILGQLACFHQIETSPEIPVEIPVEEPIEELIETLDAPIPMRRPEPIPEPQLDDYVEELGKIPQPKSPPKPQEYPVFDESEYFEQKTCYDGWIDQDRPPLPLSIYHEPCLNSSAKLDRQLIKNKAATFDAAKSVTKQAIMKEYGPAVATKVLGVSKTEILYPDLIPIVNKADISAAGAPVYEYRKALPQVSTGWTRKKSIKQRQDEEIERHKLERMIKRSEKTETNDKQTAKQRETRKSQDNEIPTAIRAYEFPWARPEFYLTKQDDGKVGFHNFRSLK